MRSAAGTEERHQHNKIEAIGGDLQIKIEQAVNTHGHQTTEGTDGQKEFPRLPSGVDLPDASGTFPNEDQKTADQGQKTDPACLYKDL